MTYRGYTVKRIGKRIGYWYRVVSPDGENLPSAHSSIEAAKLAIDGREKTLAHMKALGLIP